LSSSGVKWVTVDFSFGVSGVNGRTEDFSFGVKDLLLLYTSLILIPKVPHPHEGALQTTQMRKPKVMVFAEYSRGEQMIYIHANTSVKEYTILEE
jgi:hypothetical protein